MSGGEARRPFGNLRRGWRLRGFRTNRGRLVFGGPRKRNEAERFQFVHINEAWALLGRGLRDAVLPQPEQGSSANVASFAHASETIIMLGTILIIILLIALLGGFSGYGGRPFYGTGYYGGGGIGLLLLVVILMVATGRI
jgi:uncharacterized protein DUF3309